MSGEAPEDEPHLATTIEEKLQIVYDPPEPVDEEEYWFKAPFAPSRKWFRILAPTEVKEVSAREAAWPGRGG
jgi:hypothetical protein